MKTIVIFFAIITQVALANDEKYLATMQKNIQVLNECKTIEEYQSAANSFERVAGVETTKWEPLYYSAFSYMMMTNLEKEGSKKDSYIDLAQKAINKAKELAPNESEIFALEGFSHMMRVTVDPASRGAQYSGLAVGAYQKALALNPENPRALALLGQMQFGTAKFFGSSTDEACQTGRGALEKFDTYNNSNPLAPKWGRKMAEGLVKNCQ